MNVRRFNDLIICLFCNPAIPKDDSNKSDRAAVISVIILFSKIKHYKGHTLIKLDISISIKFKLKPN